MEIRRSGFSIVAAPSSATSDRALACVGRGPVATTTRAMLFLSRNVTLFLAPCCAQPSGYLIEYAAAAFANVRKTWLSGMSPAAAALASACSALGEPLAVPPVAVVVGAAAVVVVETRFDRWEPPPHPAVTASAAPRATVTAMRLIMGPACAAMPDVRLTAPQSGAVHI